MRHRLIPGAVLTAVLLGAGPASAQFSLRPASPQPLGENYRIELSGGLWSPTPDITVSSAQLGIIGSDIDAVGDLGITPTRFRELRVVLKGGRKHKFRFQYTPVHYEGDTQLSRRLVFNGIAYHVGLPVQSRLLWKTYRVGYEYDFIHRDRGFVGLLLETKFTDVEVSLNSPIADEFVRARAPVPAIGGIGRVYLVPNLSATFEMSGFKLPESIDEDYRARYLDYDFYGTLSFTEHFGAQVGYRSLDVMYRANLDSGNMKLGGPYFSGVVRF